METDKGHLTRFTNRSRQKIYFDGKRGEENGICKGFFGRWNYLCVGSDFNGKNKNAAGKNYGSSGMFGGGVKFLGVL